MTATISANFMLWVFLTAFVAAIGWSLGGWLIGKLLGAIDRSAA